MGERTEATRAMLADAGLVVSAIEQCSDGPGYDVTLAGGDVLWIAGPGNGGRHHAANIVADFTAAHDALAADLGLPAAADARALAADVVALRAEVARLRAVAVAFRAALTEPAGWPGVDILREALAPPPDAVPEVLDDLACRAGMVLDALAAALAALEAP